MRPAIEVAKAVYAARFWSDKDAAAVIAADRAALVAEIVKYLRDLDGRRDESNLIGWAANRVQAEFGGGNG